MVTLRTFLLGVAAFSLLFSTLSTKAATVNGILRSNTAATITALYSAFKLNKVPYQENASAIELCDRVWEDDPGSACLAVLPYDNQICPGTRGALWCSQKCNHSPYHSSYILAAGTWLATCQGVLNSKVVRDEL